MIDQPASPIAVAELCQFLKDMGPDAASFWLTARRMAFELDRLRVRHINWQPIEADMPHLNVVVGRQIDCQWEWVMDWATYLDSGEYQINPPTHWCELEEPSDDQ